MKKIVTTTVTLAVLAVSISSAQAAINITEATIQNGSVSSSGGQAPRNAAVWWEGKATPSTSKKFRCISLRHYSVAGRLINVWDGIATRTSLHEFQLPPIPATPRLLDLHYFRVPLG